MRDIILTIISGLCFLVMFILVCHHAGNVRQYAWKQDIQENILLHHPHLTRVYESAMHDEIISSDEYELIKRLAIRGIK